MRQTQWTEPAIISLQINWDRIKETSIRCKKGRTDWDKQLVSAHFKLPLGKSYFYFICIHTRWASPCYWSAMVKLQRTHLKTMRPVVIPHRSGTSWTWGWGLWAKHTLLHTSDFHWLSWRGSTTEANLSVIHKHLKHNYTCAPTDSWPLFLTWD